LTGLPADTAAGVGWVITTGVPFRVNEMSPAHPASPGPVDETAAAPSPPFVERGVQVVLVLLVEDALVKVGLET
jgi:hypothetical protein